VRPNAAHRAPAKPKASGVAVRILTQNVDGLHQKAGSSPRKAVELHGTLATTHCLSCGATEPTARALERVAAGVGDPPCPGCGGVLQPSVVMFGQFLDPETSSPARNVAARSRLFPAVGTSLTVEPAAGLCALAVEHGATLVIVNRDPTPCDEPVAEVVREPIGTALPRICAALRSAAAQRPEGPAAPLERPAGGRGPVGVEAARGPVRRAGRRRGGDFPQKGKGVPRPGPSPVKEATMDVVPFRTPGLGDTSYLLVHEGIGVLVDPQRDIDRFLDAAAERNVTLRFVADTHLHNDYVSGAWQAARRTGAELVMPAAAAPAYPHIPAFHMEDIKGEAGLVLRPIHTPGHTPEHTSYLVLIDGVPVALFSGGSLLVGSAGRTDLLGEERAASLARLQHRSLHRLAGLPREVLVLPTHGGGSLCTTAEPGAATSTIGAEADGNPLLAVRSPEEFARRLLAHPRPIPAFYRRMGPLNVRGGPPMPSPDVPVLSAARLPADVQVVDMRPREAMAAGFLPGAVGIELGEDFGSWAGWLLSPRTPLVLVAERGQDVTEAVTQLARVGLDAVAGVVTDLSGVETVSFRVADLDAAVRMARRPDVQVLDVRMPSEYEEGVVPGSFRRFLPELFAKGPPKGLDPARPVLVACASGRRSTIAASRLCAWGHAPVVLSGAGAPELAARLAEAPAGAAARDLPRSARPARTARPDGG